MWEAVKAQAATVRGAGGKPVLLGAGDAGFDRDFDPRLEGAELHRLRQFGPDSLAFAPALPQALRRAGLDLLHLHGIWQYPSAAAAGWAQESGRPLLVSPHGMLDPWITGLNRWKKAVARAVWERRCWRRAAGFHALTGAEAKDIRCEAGAQRVAVIPNPAPLHLDAPSGERQLTLLYLGRVHPKKNLEALLTGWAAAHPQLPERARLVLAGWGASEEIAALRRTVAATPAATYIGPAYGAAKDELLSEARFLVLPSLSEGLPMVVLEAWAHGTPTLMSAACHLPKGFAAGAALDCGTDPFSVARAITAAFALPEDSWRAMSASARRLASTTFSQAAVASAWERTYAGLLDTAA